jgi:P27 family predicted phage terminase small subunit
MEKDKKEKLIYERVKEYITDYQKYDDELLWAYAFTYNYMLKLKEEINNTGVLIEKTTAKGDTNLDKNPLVPELSKVIQILNNLLKSLGLTAHQRQLVSKNLPIVVREADDFEKF